MGAPCIPEKYRSATAAKLEDTLRDAILARIDARQITSADIHQRYPSIRKGHLDRLRNGDTMGFRMLTSLAEAIGLEPVLKV
ncbi:hypothetical protein E0H39_29580 [Rhizobium leguminosarum bv. viciae]|uniref:hypothetical protein n=1 Tax=Rhizobium TaxID=379 RepID=UPI00103EFBFE|nr:hypothetical protein [Rhizobium leguminosarum]TBY57970.1 hypothetical protein E0H39_29580 [Rhizobium leguminosarum bv. viciae]